MSFRALVADAEHIGYVVARFLALLELYRERLLAFEQSAPLNDLMVRWIADEEAAIEDDTMEAYAGDEDKEQSGE